MLDNSIFIRYNELKINEERTLLQEKEVRTNGERTIYPIILREGGTGHQKAYDWQGNPIHTILSL